MVSNKPTVAGKAVFLTAVVLGSVVAVWLPVLPATATAPLQDGPGASVTFEDQTSDGASVVVASVALPSGGFVVVRAPSGSIVGVSDYLEPGEHEDVNVTLEDPLAGDSELVAVAHRDTNSNREFDLRTNPLVDVAYGTFEEQRVADAAQVNVEAETPATTATPAQTGDGEQAPFDGSPATIPGRIQVEAFDEGGPGVAYNDSTQSNQGGQFRPDEGVDIEATADGDGYNVGYTVDGEWLEYTVDVTEGTYDITARVAAPAGDAEGKALGLRLNDTSLGTVEVPTTGGWQNWETVTLENVTVPNDGQSVLRLEIEGGAYNIDWIEFSPAEGNATTEGYRSGPEGI